jgi:hypothetical protein
LNTLNGFDETGFIQNVGPLSAAGCAGNVPHKYLGGTVTINREVITVPCYMIVQLPANTMTWSELVDASPPTGTGIPLTGLELTAQGNIVVGAGGTRRIAGLMYISQESLYSDSGFVTAINYATGSLTVDNNVIQINDPVINDPTDPANGTGRFSKGQSPDPRFSVDQANPTIHAATGYPMCIPRFAPDPTNVDPTKRDDPLCPQKNRPRVNVALPASGCRNFNQASVALPVSGELGAPLPTQTFCSQFVMKAAPGAGASLANTAGPTDPDVLQQAPFEIGDYITYSGTRLPVGGGNFIISAHTIEANVGIYTQPGFQPSYLAIGEFGVGTSDLVASVTGVPQETTNRIFLEAETTDLKAPVHIFMVDKTPGTGAIQHRWLSMYEMTGECNFAAPLAAACMGNDGGLTTQNIGPQPQRARIRAPKSINGIMNQASRTIKVMVGNVGAPQNCMPPNLRGLLNVATGHYAPMDNCLAGLTPVANGLIAGQYEAPIFEYIFPENAKPGDPLVPNDLYQIAPLRFGEGDGLGAAGSITDGPLGLTPTPW